MPKSKSKPKANSAAIYLFGAGASINALPVISEMRYRMATFIYISYLVAKKFVAIRYPNGGTPPLYRKDFKKCFETLLGLCRELSTGKSIDRVLREIYTNDKAKFNMPNALYSLYFIFETHTTNEDTNKIASVLSDEISGNKIVKKNKMANFFSFAIQKMIDGYECRRTIIAILKDEIKKMIDAGKDTNEIIAILKDEIKRLEDDLENRMNMTTVERVKDTPKNTVRKILVDKIRGMRNIGIDISEDIEIGVDPDMCREISRHYRQEISRKGSDEKREKLPNTSNNKDYLDDRYKEFLINFTSPESKIISMNKLLVITWNYDQQFEKAALSWGIGSKDEDREGKEWLGGITSINNTIRLKKESEFIKERDAKLRDCDDHEYYYFSY